MSAFSWSLLLCLLAASAGMMWLLMANQKLRVKAAQLQNLTDQASDLTRVKSEFLNNMSHELRTPLNGILGMADLALGTELDDLQQECLTAINDSAQHLLNSVRDILDCSSIEAGTVQLRVADLDLHKLITGTVRAFATGAQEKELEILYSIGRDVPRCVRGDAVRLRQILVNLLGNAIKFTKSGEVELRCVTELVSAEHVRLRFSIRDTGIGIVENQHKEIFRAFAQADASTTREFGGSGLGLTISNQLVRLMGGNMRLESVPGKGSTFHFTVKLDVAVKPPLPPDAIAPDLSLVGKRMLIVDDNEANLNNVASTLSGDEVIVEKARNASSALEKLRSAQHAGMPFDVLIIDSDMPTTNGFALAEQLGSEPGMLCPAVMMLTSKNLSEHAAKCKRLGITYLLKPVSTDQLKEVASELVRKIEHQRQTAPSPVAPSVTPVASLPAPGSSGLVLLAEDKMDNQRSSVALLKKNHFEVHVVGSAAEALASWRHRRFDLIVIDIQVAGMRGTEVARRIRAAEALGKRHTSIVALTDNDSEAVRRDCLIAGMDDCLVRASGPEKLIDKMRYHALHSIY